MPGRCRASGSLAERAVVLVLALPFAPAPGLLLQFPLSTLNCGTDRDGVTPFLREVTLPDDWRRREAAIPPDAYQGDTSVTAGGQAAESAGEQS